MPHHRIVVLPVREAAMTFAFVVLLLYVFWFSYYWPFAAGMLGLRLFGFWLLLYYSFDHCSVRCLSNWLCLTFIRQLSLLAEAAASMSLDLLFGIFTSELTVCCHLLLKHNYL